jgi:hypothetical protein
MNRWLHGGLALSAGFVSALLAIHVADSGHPSTVVAGTKLGDLKPLDYCTTAYGDRATAVQISNDAYGWRCWVTVNGLVTAHEIDYGTACEVLFSPPAYAQTYNVDLPYSWQCFRGPQAAGN